MDGMEAEMAGSVGQNLNTIGVVIVNYNEAEKLLVCLQSLYAKTHIAPADTIIVDNNSTDNLTALINSHYPNIRIIQNPDNYGYAKAANIGINQLNLDIILLINPDLIWKQGDIWQAITLLNQNPYLLAVGFKLLQFDGAHRFAGGDFYTFSSLLRSRQSIFTELGILKVDNGIQASVPTAVDWVVGGATLINRKLFLQLGGFDEDYWLYVEDLDLCWRAKQQGYAIMHFPDIILQDQSPSQSRSAAAIIAHHKGMERWMGKRVKPWMRWFVKVGMRVNSYFLSDHH
jgi:GT2 family glycosyltransferase